MQNTFRKTGNGMIPGDGKLKWETKITKTLKITKNSQYPIPSIARACRESRWLYSSSHARDSATRIVAESRAGFDEHNYRDSLQARAIEGIGYCKSKLKLSQFVG